ncbi:hypothetical protein NC653_021362 [Populus alba x Populus x berolinensis]|uniref:Uncharacterized protein n=1 Tax=Populus alba x Populus x berolinensis TaxID=444605 RepID=A0AAD6QEL7_9ROSI|nr:hypothetical protein NC653_021362 [Populus alba x Populus x berolinensis]
MWAPSRALEPPFKARVGSPLHGSLAIPIFSAKHALAKEKGFRNPMPTFLLVYSQYSHHLVLIAISPFQLTEKKTAEHGQKTRSPDGLVTPASASFHDLRLVCGIPGPLLGCLEVRVLIQCSRKLAQLYSRE